jgi:hypothetical protein
MYGVHKTPKSMVRFLQIHIHFAQRRSTTWNDWASGRYPDREGEGIKVKRGFLFNPTCTIKKQEQIVSF